MRTLDPRNFKFIPVRDLIDDPDSVPNERGVYTFFFRGGARLLQETGWFELDGRRPLSVHGHAYLYTGGAYCVGNRLKQHVRVVNIHTSSLRTTLLAIECATNAISRSGTSACRVRGQQSLTEWLRKNAIVGIQFSKTPFELERKLLAVHPSPLNIVWRRQHPFARQLSAWRCEVFPKGDSRPAHKMRKL